MNPIAINEEQLSAELAAGETCYLSVPLSQAHLFALVASAQLTCARLDCPDSMKLHLQDFQMWCGLNAGFGPETRRALLKNHQDLNPTRNAKRETRNGEGPQ